MPISKEKFTKILNQLRDSNDLVDKVNELFRSNRDKVDCEFCDGAGLQICHESLVVELLQMLTHDKAEDISYFIYELDYGREYRPGCITDENGRDIDFSTPEKLYDYLEAAYE